MIDLLVRYTLPAALSLLPARMDSPAARALLVAIALQESGLTRRRQLGTGPARSFWQFDPGDRAAFALVFAHPKTDEHARTVARRLAYPYTGVETMRQASEHNDVLACAIARLLLWTVPAPLPGRAEASEAWAQYLRAWNPGHPRPETWTDCYVRGWMAIEPEAAP